MTNREFADKDVRCASCSGRFVLSAGEQELLRLRGITAQPETCPNCVGARSWAGPPKLSADRSSA